ncbi:ornithine--oxo-acid transaminase [Zoogloea sp.]|uniref:ornithine--oxo-acid transaminase n=1 Tax=Zoogloea sp. TaxID=49181 RepID=UPI00262ED633|nr:ornithine--oxo-acid transaminase [Zoogloea sp.]MDD3353038.1 ornithine--oxo-acid transaminase [Zoogloea sp.]
MSALLVPPRPVRIIGAGSCLGAPIFGPAAGPRALKDGGIDARLRQDGIDARWHSLLEPAAPKPPQAPLHERIGTVGAFLHDLAAETAAICRAGDRPLVLGGDHAIAAGTWRGVARAIAARGKLGLIWIDAHLDAHTEHSTHSGNIHGMPLAALLGIGDARLTGLPGPHLDPAHIAIIGARSWEPEEKALLESLGVRIFYMPEVRRRGLAVVLDEALSIARQGTAGFGVSVDLDAMSCDQLPATTCLVPDGLAPQELVDSLHALRNCSDLQALEIVEYVPDRDRDGLTARRVEEIAAAALGPGSDFLQARENHFGARNYAPLPVVFTRGEGVWLWDVEGRRYLDMMSAYSAVSFGHSHPRLVRALAEQAGRLALTSRAYSNDRLPLLLEHLTRLLGYDRALPVNTGLEAVETAVKAARKWAHRIKGIPDGEAEIIVCANNFHGRSTTIVSFSSDEQYRSGFGPLTPGFRTIPFGDADALAAAITPRTAAFLFEPIQGEGGIRIPPEGWLARCAALCRQHQVLLIADEVQTGLGRTGYLLACEHDGVRPDGVILGKALGGGLLPVSAFLADQAVMQVFQPGDHGSTFGGNPLASAVAMEALAVLVDEGLAERSARLGAHLLARLQRIANPLIREVRGRGLMIGLELDIRRVSARLAAETLLARGLMTKDTHDTVLRFAPPLVISEAELDWAARLIEDTLNELAERFPPGATP